MRDPLRWLSVRYKLALLFVGLCLIAYGLGGYLISDSAKRALKTEILSRLEYQCQSYATALDSYLQMLSRRTEDFASDGYIRDHLKRITVAAEAEEGDRLRAELLHHLRVNKLPIVPAFQGLSVIDGEGQVVVDLVAEGQNELPPVSFPSQGDQLWYSDILLPVGSSMSPALLIQTPLRGIRSNAVIGYLQSRVGVGVWMAGALRSLHPEIVEEAEDVRLALRDQKGGQILVPADFGLQPVDPSKSEIVQSGIGLRVVEGTRSPPSSRGYSATRGIFAQSFPVSANGWTVEVSMRSDTALMPISGLQSRFLGMGLLLAILSTFLLYFPMKFLAKPLVVLKGAAQKIREGEFGTRVDIDSSDEIGDLAAAFNHMAAGIQERTERLEASTQRLQQEQARTREERDRLDTVIASMKDGLVVMDRQGKIVMANSASGSLLDLVRNRGHVATSHHLCETSRKGNHPNCLSCLTDPGEPNRSCVVDVGKRTYEVHATSMKSGDDGRAGRVLVSRDITDRIAHDERQIHQERLAVLGEVAAVMAHELNNPLASINMFNQMLQSELPEESELRENTEIIARNTETCKRSIRALLEYATGAQPEVNEVSIHDILEDASYFLRPISQRSGIAIRHDFQAADPLVTGDEVQLRQVFVNLMMNAIQAMDGAGEIRLSTRKNGSYVEILVFDTGPGIEPEAVEEVFRPFFTSKRRGAGTGLGLPTSRRITEMHGGTLELHETGPHGTAFQVRFRIQKPPLS